MFFSFLFRISAHQHNFSFKNDCDNCLNFTELNNKFQPGDEIFLFDSIIKDDNAKEILEFLNKTGSKGIRVRGSNTVISNPSYLPTDYPIFYTEKSISISNITFEGLQISAINAKAANVELNHVSFINANVTKATLLAFIECEVTMNDVTIYNSTANDQSYILGLATTFTLDFFNFSRNFMSTSIYRAMIFVSQSSLTIMCSNFTLNEDMSSFPLLAISSNSTFICEKSTIDSNNVSPILNSELGSESSFEETVIIRNNGQVTAGKESKVSFLKTGILYQTCADSYILSFESSNISFYDTNFTNCTVYGLAVNTNEGSLKIFNVRGRNIKAAYPLFSAIGCSVEMQIVRMNRVESSADAIILTAANGTYLNIDSCKFARLSAQADSPVSVAIDNMKSADLQNVRFSRNNACGLISHLTATHIHFSNFTLNKCHPKNSEVPLGLLTLSELKNVFVTNSTFVNNSALAGSLLLINSTANIAGARFENNNATRGSSIFAADSRFSIADASFIRNRAVAGGAALALQHSTATLTKTNFTLNEAPEGPSIYLLSKSRIKVNSGYSYRNAGNGSLLWSDSDSRAFLSEMHADDDLKVAITARDGSVKLEHSKFGCSKHCVDVGSNFPIMWVAPPLIFLVIVLVIRSYTDKCISFVTRHRRMKDKYVL